MATWSSWRSKRRPRRPRPCPAGSGPQPARLRTLRACSGRRLGSRAPGRTFCWMKWGALPVQILPHHRASWLLLSVCTCCAVQCACHHVARVNLLTSSCPWLILHDVCRLCWGHCGLRARAQHGHRTGAKGDHLLGSLSCRPGSLSPCQGEGRQRSSSSRRPGRWHVEHCQLVERLCCPSGQPRGAARQ